MATETEVLGAPLLAITQPGSHRQAESPVGSTQSTGRYVRDLHGQDDSASFDRHRWQCRVMSDDARHARGLHG